MENRRFFLFAVFGALLFFTYQTWKKDYPASLIAPVAATATPAPIAAPGEDALPAAATAAPTGAVSTTETTPAAVASTARIEVLTDKLQVEISLAGGDLRRAELLGYPVSKDKPEENLALLDDRDPHYFILQSGLASTDKPLISASTVFTAPASRFVLADGSNTLDVPLTVTDANGLQLTKVYRFTRGSYQIVVTQLVNNSGAVALQASPYARLQRTPVRAGYEPPFSQTFIGEGFYEQKEPGKYRFKKISFDKLTKEPFETTQTGGWLAMLQHYFVAAILPPAGEQATFSGKPSTIKGYLAQYHGPLKVIEPGQTGTYTTQFYVGPKLQGLLEDVAPGFELTEDYGILAPIAKPLFWLMKKLHQYTGNWGVAIILLTLLVKGAMYKLSEAQYRSMARMKKFTPRIAEIRERHAGDREKLNKAMMELYTKEKFNPLAGCWPMLVQFPVFIALYWVLNESVELRQADFALWLTDLSSPDPFYVLPVLFGLSMWFQQKLGGQMATMEPMQQRMMQFMPIALTAFFAFFPAGLVLYWFVSNLISITQQWFITKKIENEPAKVVAAKR
ncbi:MAG: membrane protein insertase YidC [Stagnimonas sp.]|nr:membrane protein insertase YidC [Stagnimonas sp.]